MIPPNLSHFILNPFPCFTWERRNIVERAAYRDTTDEITPADLGLLPHEDLANRKGSFHEKMDAFARRLVFGALTESQGNQVQAARNLGLSYHQFRYYRKKHGSSD